VSAAGLLLFSTVSSLWALAVGFGMFGLGSGTAMTAAFTAAGSVIPRQAHGVSFGLLTSAMLFGTSFGPVLGGLIAGQSIRAVFVVGAIGLILLALVVRRLMIVPPPRVESPPAPEP
jgi:MFS family permease